MNSIAGLSERQMAIADILWMCQTVDDLNIMISVLPTERDRIDARGIIWMITVDELEEVGQLDKFESDAQSVINAAKN